MTGPVTGMDRPVTGPVPTCHRACPPGRVGRGGATWRAVRKKTIVETEIAAKQEANAETNRELQKLEEAVDSKEKELGSHKLDTLCAQVGTLKGLAESARMDGDDVAARLLETQVDIANRAVTGLTRAYDLALDEIVAAGTVNYGLRVALVRVQVPPECLQIIQTVLRGARARGRRVILPN